MNSADLEGNTKPRAVTSRVQWIVPNLAGNVTVKTRLFDGTGDTDLLTLPTDSQDVEILVQNYMAGDVAGQFYHAYQKKEREDTDFKWYYQFLAGDDRDVGHARGWVLDRLRSRGIELPHPVQVPGQPSTKGWIQNCMPTLFPDTTW